MDYGHAMYGKITFKDGAAEQKNYNNYRLIRMKEIPEIEAHFVDNGIDPTGLGEPALASNRWRCCQCNF